MSGIKNGSLNHGDRFIPMRCEDKKLQELLLDVSLDGSGNKDIV